MGLVKRTADLLQDAVEGGPADHPRVRDLLPTATAVGSLAVACRPDPDFVEALGRRLQAEAAELATRQTAKPPTRSAVRTPVRRAREPKPVIVLVGRGLPRLLAGVAASLVAVGGVVGVASRSALPGQALYQVKQVLDDAAVRLANSPAEKGATRLSQAQEHIVEVARLVNGPTPAGSDVDVALHSAIDDVTQGQALLRQSFEETHNPRSLLAIEDFSARAIPQVDVLGDRVPAGSLPLVSTLRALLGAAGDNAVQQLSSCQACGAAGETARLALAPARPASDGASALPNLAAPPAPAAPLAPPAPLAPAARASTAPPAPAAASAPAAVPASVAGVPASVAGVARPAAVTGAPTRSGPTATVPGGVRATTTRAAAAPTGPLLPGATATAAPVRGVDARADVPSDAGTRGVAVSTGAVSASLPVGGATAAPPVGGATAALPVGRATASLPVGGATAAPPVGEATAALPVGEATASLPVGEATAALPSSTVGAGGATAGSGGITPTLPGVRVTAPLPGVTLAPTRSCLPGICPH